MEEGETTLSKMKYHMIERATELMEASENTEAMDSIMENIEDIKETLENIISDNSEAIGNTLSEETILSILESIMGAEFKDCSYMQKLCVAAALYSYGSVAKRLDVDKPRNLAKSVTVE